MSTSCNLLFFPGFFASMASGLIIFWGCLYFLPTIIAMVRSKSNRGAILLLNLFLGWTFIGWIVSLVWALAAEPESQPHQVIINNTMPVGAGNQSSPVNQSAPNRSTALTLQKNTPTHQDKIDQLRQLKELLDNGVLTQDEFDQQKARILG
jgi:hypothetical protein